MAGVQIIISVLLASAAGTGAGFCTGLVPGLHVNNLAAVVVAGSASVTGLFTYLGHLSGFYDEALLVACFLVAAMVAHMFSESIVATYLGIPSGDNISLLPAHRLAKEGLGARAILSSADGSLAGAVLGLSLLLPVCMLLGPPVNAYDSLRVVMGFAVAILSSLLVASEGFGRPRAHRRVLLGLVFFFLSGVLGIIVLDTNYFAASIPDLPWMQSGFVPKSALLLPLFAGLFGVPTLLLSIGQNRSSETITVRDSSHCRLVERRPVIRLREIATSSIGGVLVGWIPGVTSGSSAALCASAVKGAAPEGGRSEEAARFIWLYSAISSCGAVLSVGALFVIARARSGIMQAVVHFMEDDITLASDRGIVYPACAILLSMLASAAISHIAIRSISGAPLIRLQKTLCSRGTAIASLVFVMSLVLVLTGLRGGLVLFAAVTLGLLPPLCGSRRINLMGCLLLPICITFLMG